MASASRSVTIATVLQMTSESNRELREAKRLGALPIAVLLLLRAQPGNHRPKRPTGTSLMSQAISAPLSCPTRTRP